MQNDKTTYKSCFGSLCIAEKRHNNAFRGFGFPDGTIRFTDAGNDNIISYERVLNGQKLTVLCNLRGTEQAPGTPFEAPGGRLLIGNYADRDASSAVEKITALQPYETVAVLQG